MSVLAHAPHFTDRRTLHTFRKPGALRRLLHRFLQWRQRRAEHDIAIHLGLTGGHITDEIERRINDRLVYGGGFRN